MEYSPSFYYMDRNREVHAAEMREFVFDDIEKHIAVRLAASFKRQYAFAGEVYDAAMTNMWPGSCMKQPQEEIVSLLEFLPISEVPGDTATAVFRNEKYQNAVRRDCPISYALITTDIKHPRFAARAAKEVQSLPGVRFALPYILKDALGLTYDDFESGNLSSTIRRGFRDLPPIEYPVGLQSVKSETKGSLLIPLQARTVQ